MTDRQTLSDNRVAINRIIPRVQLPSGNNHKQLHPDCEISLDVPRAHAQKSRRIQRTVQYDNKAYDLED